MTYRDILTKVIQISSLVGRQQYDEAARKLASLEVELLNNMDEEDIPSNNPNSSDFPGLLKQHLNYDFQYNCCKNCPNSPSNGGSGVCNCTAPYFEMARTGNTIDSVTYEFFKTIDDMRDEY